MQNHVILVTTPLAVACILLTPSVHAEQHPVELVGEDGTINVTLDAEGRLAAAASGKHQVRYERDEAGLLARVHGETRRTYEYSGARLVQVIMLLGLRAGTDGGIRA